MAVECREMTKTMTVDNRELGNGANLILFLSWAMFSRMWKSSIADQPLTFYTGIWTRTQSYRISLPWALCLFIMYIFDILYCCVHMHAPIIYIINATIVQILVRVGTGEPSTQFVTVCFIWFELRDICSSENNGVMFGFDFLVFHPLCMCVTIKWQWIRIMFLYVAFHLATCNSEVILLFN